MLGGLALGLLLLGGAGFWLYGQFGVRSGTDAPAAPSIEVIDAPGDDPEALIPGRAPPTAGGSRPSVSVADDVPIESADADVPVEIGADPPSAAVRPPPPRLQDGLAAEASDLPPIPVTDDPVDLDSLKAVVLAANARDIDALYAASPDPRGPETRAALDVAIRALAKGLYRHQVVDGHGDLEAARAELRSFLRGLEHKGLGLSDAVVESGVAHVGP
ncbi:MAG: hypothetical protein MUE46_12980 [Xanthomonadales bacterium]|nr:hypothetical protein [Xanthomonadales bacterium]